MTRFLTVREIQHRYRISRASIYRWREDSDIQFPAPIKIGHRVLWREDDLDAFDARFASS